MSQAQLIPTSTLSSFPPIAYHGIPVLTTEMLAQAYEVGAEQIRQNFKRNRERFIENKHFIQISGNELKEFKNCVTNCHSVQIGKRTASLTLWTDRGAARHAKSLNTDRAWDMYELLEETFFRVAKSEPVEPTPTPSPISKRSDPERKALTAIINTWVGMAPIHYAAARAQVNAHFGVASVDALTVAQVKEAIQYVQGKIDALPPTEVELAALPAAADIDGHLAAIREHIRRIRDHEDAIFLIARKAMPLRGVGPSVSLASLIHQNMENAGWSLHYALENMEASARFALVAGRG